MRYARSIVLVLIAGLAVSPSVAGASDRYRGTLTDFAGSAQHGTFIGDDHILKLVDRRKMRRHYRVCLSGGSDPIKRCYTRNTSGKGVGKVNVSSPVNADGGPGRYVARWYVGKKRVALWKFRVRSQVGESSTNG